MRGQVDTHEDRLDFQWLLQPSRALDYCHYGLMLAAAIGVPQEVLREAHRCSEAHWCAVAAPAQPGDMSRQAGSLTCLRGCRWGRLRQAAACAPCLAGRSLLT